MRIFLPLLFLAGFLAGCAVPEGIETSDTLREASWGPIPDYYVWDGYEYVGFSDGGYYYLGPGENWLAFDAYRRDRFRLWCAAHPDWRRHAVENRHHRRGHDGRVHPPRPERNPDRPGDWKDPGLHHPVPPPLTRQEPGSPGDRRKEDRHGDRPQGHPAPSPAIPLVPQRTDPDDHATRPPMSPPPHKDRTKADRDKHGGKPKITPPAPRAVPKAPPPGPPQMTPPPPPSVKLPPPPAFTPSTPPKVDPPRQSDKPADKADDKDGDRHKKR